MQLFLKIHRRIHTFQQGDYRVQDDFGATDSPIELTREQIDTARNCIAAINIPGVDTNTSPLLYARVDFLTSDDGELCVNELELVEPSLFFRHAPKAAEVLADSICKRL